MCKRGRVCAHVCMRGNVGECVGDCMCLVQEGESHPID